MENKYIFDIQTHDNQINSDSYLGGRDISIVREEEDGRPPYYFFTSVHLNALSDPKEIWRRGLSLLALYNGSRNLNFNPGNSYGSPANYSFRGLLIWHGYQDITPHNYHELVPDKPFDLNLPAGNQYTYPNPNNFYDKVIRLSISKPDILILLLQLGNGLRWVNLYAIYDTLKTFSNKIEGQSFENLVKHCGYSLGGEIKAFTGTANNFGLLGTEARHGEMNWTKPDKVISLPEAQIIVLNLSRKYLQLVYSLE